VVAASALVALFIATRVFFRNRRSARFVLLFGVLIVALGCVLSRLGG
jgi:hypothetical protein